MRHVKVRPISSAPLRLPPPVLRQAQGLARSAGVSVAELIELLLLGLLEAEAGQIVPPPAPPVPAQRRGAPRQPARILVMEDFRRRTPACVPLDTGAAEGPSIRARAAGLRRQAARVRARSARVCEAAKRARETARVALEELSHIAVVGPVSAPAGASP